MIHARVIMACADALWAIQEEKLEQITAFLRLKLDGGSVSAEDLARITKTTEREVAAAPGGIAVLPVFGTLAPRMNMMDDMSGGTSLMQLGAGFRAALADPAVKAIVFDHDSPGGTVAGTGELADEIFNSRGVKPIIAHVNNLSASAAYWLGAAADEVVVTPGGEAGALGVYRVHEDISKMLEQRGIRPTIIRSEGSPHKVEAANIAPLGDEARQHIQDRVNQQFDRMVRAIAEYRGTTMTKVRDGFGRGRVFGAEELVSRGMADRIDTLEGTLERFGSGEFNPVANRNRGARMARAQAAEALAAKLQDVAAGDPTIDEWEEGLAAAFGLSQKKRKRAVALLKDLHRDGAGPTQPHRDGGGQPAQRDVEGKTENRIKTEDVAGIRGGLDDLRSAIDRLHAVL